MANKIVAKDVGLLVLRIALGLTMLYFGSQKVFGLFGGQGYGATVEMMNSKMGIPVVFAHLGILGEFAGGLGVLAGCLTRVAAFGVACTMAVATFISAKGPGVLGGIFSGSPGADASKLFFPAILCSVAISLIIMGPGLLSVDQKFIWKAKR